MVENMIIAFKLTVILIALLGILYAFFIILKDFIKNWKENIKWCLLFLIIYLISFCITVKFNS